MHHGDDSFKLLPEASQLLHVLLGLGVELDHLLPTAHTPVLIVGLHGGVDTGLECQQLNNNNNIVQAIIHIHVHYFSVYELSLKFIMTIV